MILDELLTSDAGLMAVGVIGFMVGMGIFMYFKFRSLIRSEAEQARKS